MSPEQTAVLDALTDLNKVAEMLLSRAQITDDPTLKMIFTELASASIEANAKNVNAIKGMALHFISR